MFTYLRYLFYSDCFLQYLPYLQGKCQPSITEYVFNEDYKIESLDELPVKASLYPQPPMARLVSCLSPRNSITFPQARGTPLLELLRTCVLEVEPRAQISVLSTWFHDGSTTKKRSTPGPIRGNGALFSVHRPVWLCVPIVGDDTVGMFIKRVVDFARVLFLGGLQKFVRGEDFTMFDYAGRVGAFIHGLLKDVNIPAIEEVSVETPSGGILHSPFKGPVTVAWPQTREYTSIPGMLIENGRESDRIARRTNSAVVSVWICDVL